MRLKFCLCRLSDFHYNPLESHLKSRPPYLSSPEVLPNQEEGLAIGLQVRPCSGFSVAARYTQASIDCNGARNGQTSRDNSCIVSPFHCPTMRSYRWTSSSRPNLYGKLIQTPLGPRKILLADAVYVPAFHTNLACLRKFNDKNV